MKPNYEQKREKAIAAAAVIFAEKGYHGSTTKDIADHIGIRQGSLYYYFKSKEEALEEVCVLALRDYVSRMENIATSDTSFEEKIYQTIYSHLSSYRDNNEALKVHNDQRLYLPEQKRARIKTDGSRYREVLENIYKEQARLGGIPDTIDCLFMAQSVIGLCNSWGALLLRDEEINIEQLAEKCTQMALKGCQYHSFQNTATQP